jgi:hypothetical protein
LKTLSTQDYKEYFEYLDSLANFREVNYSIFSRYFCTAGCKVCYVKEQMLEAQKDHLVSNNIEQEIKNLQEVFDIVSFSDDLFYIRKYYPNEYQIIKKNSNNLYFGGMTDNQWLKIGSLLNDFDFIGITESSFTDVFFRTHKKKLLEILSELKLLPEQIKIIETTEDISDIISSLEPFCNNIHSQKMITFTPNNIPVLRDNVINNALYSSFGKIYFSLLDNIEEKTSLGSLENIPKLVYSVLNTKINFYKETSLKENLNVVAISLNIKDNSYASRIFKEIRLNEGGNFIPSSCFHDAKRLKEKLISLGYLNTEYGLLYLNGTSIIPLFEWI